MIKDFKPLYIAEFKCTDEYVMTIALADGHMKADFGENYAGYASRI